MAQPHAWFSLYLSTACFDQTFGFCFGLLFDGDFFTQVRKSWAGHVLKCIFVKRPSQEDPT